MESLPNNLEADLDQVWENLKLLYFKPSARYTQIKVMQKWWFELREMSLQEYENRYYHIGIQLLKELPNKGAFIEDKLNSIFYFSLSMWQ